MKWSAGQQKRLEAERLVLGRYNRSFRWLETADGLSVEGWVWTNSKQSYGVRLLVFPDYPESVPGAFITYPKPLRARGYSLAEASRAMHVLKPDAHGNIKICHHSEEVWTE